MTHVQVIIAHRLGDLRPNLQKCAILGLNWKKSNGW